MASALPRRKICVIGAGVIGLSTAYRLLEELPNVDVTVISEEYSPNTTGDGSAGFWMPFYSGNTPNALIWKWGKETFDHLHKISLTPEGGALGVFQSTGYDIYKTLNVKDNFWKDIVFGYRKMTETELQQFAGGYRYGYVYTTMMCECKTYLPWLRRRFIAKGGTCIQKKVNSLTEVAVEYEVIVNCPGVWANQLANDSEVYPLKGQVIRVDAPWLKHFVNAAGDDDLYILVGSSTVVLGGTHDKGDWTTSTDPAQRQRILQGCCRLVPSLEKAKVVEEWSGLRPGRSSVRLETEQIQYGGRIVNVVHNYGHGGSGVTLHWGCAGEAVKLVKDSLQSLSSKL